jgi:predicted transcriptional regulator
MTLEEVREILEAELIAGENLPQIRVEMGCGADLMSDVLAFSKSGALLLTGLTNPQVARTSEMAEVAAVCFVRGKRPPKETIALAAKNGLPLLTTQLPMFEACGRLYGRGLKGCSERVNERDKLGVR